ncbi:DUF6153 family protein [Streptomyces kebangsaanensis]|uniref:DUF6153 family protein n=1 Tax=Streptomyces kebangsaanensis TaxID=864058 RepID=UPI001F25221D|nr:DUF6153 family protein [Streptomyces kebangsaanensis]
MTVRAQLRRASAPLMWSPALLVLGLLVGLVGMHGLAPGGATTVTGHHFSTAAHADMAVMSAQSVCHDDGDGTGRAHHADAACSSGAVGAGPALPVLLPDPAGQTASPVGGHRSMEAEPEGGRAPPSLAELQLLRI